MQTIEPTYCYLVAELLEFLLFNTSIKRSVVFKSSNHLQVHFENDTAYRWHDSHPITIRKQYNRNKKSNDCFLKIRKKRTKSNQTLGIFSYCWVCAKLMHCNKQFAKSQFNVFLVRAKKSSIWMFLIGYNDSNCHSNSI